MEFFAILRFEFVEKESHMENITQKAAVLTGDLDFLNFGRICLSSKLVRIESLVVNCWPLGLIV